MTVRRRIRWFAYLGLTLTVGLGSGCRLFNKGGSGGGSLTSGTRDPLLGRDRIPAQNLPTGRENAKGGRDPLLTPPGENENRLSSDLPPGTSGSGPKVPFRTGPETTAAGLARGPASDDPLLTVQAEEPTDRRATGSTTGRGGPVMLKGGRGASEKSETGTGFDEALADLKRYGVKVGEPLREGGDYVLRGERESADGLRRRYEGTGATAAAAANDLLEQVRSDRAP
ncbi:hypothetical protein [Limnoglobus roseus]|uniref:Uncharacterized protein n=1 Tax=Limnoglobus roseus TaxID=2598579 RepID=A0A5C1AD22_9BACT|nr:hypothetical protein [Limnoglobus roseus]QEL16600.1 hypothetical protein PX52LOC_03560 [Limnoglobus roseus]